MMTIEINGKEQAFVENETVKQLLKRMNYIFPLVVVKINGTVVPRKDFSEVIVPDESTINILHMISGG
jgi:thiamine biosynthesis protein ThiS